MNTTVGAGTEADMMADMETATAEDKGVGEISPSLATKVGIVVDTMAVTMAVMTGATMADTAGSETLRMTAQGMEMTRALDMVAVTAGTAVGKMAQEITIAGATGKTVTAMAGATVKTAAVKTATAMAGTTVKAATAMVGAMVKTAATTAGATAKAVTTTARAMAKAATAMATVTAIAAAVMAMVMAMAGVTEDTAVPDPSVHTLTRRRHRASSHTGPHRRHKPTRRDVHYLPTL